MSKIHQLFNPDKIWEEFYIKFPARFEAKELKEQEFKYAHRLNEEEKKAFDLNLKHHDEKSFLSADSAARKIQKYWKKRREQDNITQYSQILMLDDDEIVEKESCNEKFIYLQKDKSGCLIAFSFKNAVKILKKVKDENAVILLKKFEDYIRVEKISNMEEFDKLLSLCGFSDLFPVNIKGNHNADFVEFVHNQRIKKSINKKKLNTLLIAIQGGAWNDPIFEDPHLPQLAASLFASKKITQQQTATILERVQTFKDHKHIETVSILDEKGEFTEKANKILIPALSGKFLTELNSEQLNEFRLLISKLPKSEQIFYVTNGDKYKKEYEKSLRDAGMARSFRLLMIHLESIYKNKNNDDYNLVNLPAGVRDALGIVRFGLGNYIRMVPTLGEKTPKEIEEGIRQKKRFGALSYPGTIPYRNIHDYKEITDLEATSHDVYHSNVMSTFASEIQNGFLMLVQSVREVTRSDLQSDWSKEIWDWIDCEFNLLFKYNKYFDTQQFRKNGLSIAEITTLFCDALLFGGKSNNISIRNYILPKKYIKEEYIDDFKALSSSINIIPSLRDLTPLGAIFLLDVLKNKDKWKKNKIDFDTLADSHPIKKPYQEIAEIYPSMAQDDPKIQIFKVLLYQNLKSKEQDVGIFNFKFFSKSKDIVDEKPKPKDQFKVISKLISESKAVSSKIKFKKVTTQDIQDLKLSKHEKNSIYLSFDDIRIDIDSDKNDVLIDRIVGIIAQEKEIGDLPGDIANFKKAILDLHYDLNEAIQYVKKHKYGDDEREPTFSV